MRPGLLGGELAAALELGRERVVVGELLDLPVADAVGARVADVADRDEVVLDERDRDRGAHPRGGHILQRLLPDAAVRLADQRLDVLRAGGGLDVLPQRGGGDARGDLARLVAAHPVGDREERRLADVGVLVAAALVARVGRPGGVADRHRW